MAITVQCSNPGCGVTFPRADTDAGRIVPCPSCGTSVAVRPGGAPAGFQERTLGNYRLLRPIAKGGMGEVYEAEHLRLRRRVALKLLSPHLVKDDVFLRRFEREARSAAALNHPHITKVFDFGMVEGHAFLVMEFLEGGDLAKRVAKDGKLPVDEALRVTEDVAGALQEAHRAGIIHRDIKPGNLLLAGDGTVKVSDLGLARGLADEATITATGVAVGTPHFMSPEQARDSRRVDHRADIYSLGITLLYLLTGRRPFDGGSSFSVLQAHAEAPLPTGEALGTKLPDPVEALIRHMAAKQPAERYPDYPALIEDIQRVRRGEQPICPVKADAPAADSETEVVKAPKPHPPPSKGGRISIVGSESVKAFVKPRRTVNLATAAIAVLVTLAVFLAALVVRMTRQLKVAHRKPAPAARAATVTPVPPVAAAPKKSGGELWDEYYNGMPRPLVPLYPVQNPLADGPAEELWQQAGAYAQSNPSNYRTIIAGFEQVKAKAAGTPLAARAQQAIRDWTAKQDAAGEKALEQFKAEFKRILEQGGHPQAMFIWSQFPMEVRSEAVEEKAWAFLLENGRPPGMPAGGPPSRE